MEVRLFVADPRHEFGDLRMRTQRFSREIAALKLLVRESCMNGAVTDRVDGHRLASAEALRHGMVPLDTPADRPLAEETAKRLLA